MSRPVRSPTRAPARGGSHRGPAAKGRQETATGGGGGLLELRLPGGVRLEREEGALPVTPEFARRDHWPNRRLTSAGD